MRSAAGRTVSHGHLWQCLWNIINQPQVGILALGAIRKKPAVVESEGDMIAVRHLMFLSTAMTTVWSMASLAAASSAA